MSNILETTEEYDDSGGMTDSVPTTEWTDISGNSAETTTLLINTSDILLNNISETTTLWTTTTEEPVIRIESLVNNTLSRSIWSRLPSGRTISDNPLEPSCPILKTNNTLETLIPGWEGIPTNIMVNIILATILFFGFYFLFLRKVYKTERLLNAEYVANERSSDWIHFVFGKRGTKQTLLDTTKQINRDHPNAYLPVVLHKHRHLIGGKLEEEVPEQTIDKLELKDDIKTDNFETPSESLRTTSDTINLINEEDREQVAHLKSILFDEDMSKSSTYERVINEQEKAIYRAKQTKQWVVNEGSAKSLREWFVKYLAIRDQDIYDRRGYDALQYLMFQRYLIYYLFSLTIICLFIILPLNLYAGKLNNYSDTYYKRTTILNIKKGSPLIYVHSLMTIFVVSMGIYLMKSFSHLIGTKVKNIDNRILLIENIPKLKRNPIQLKEFLLKKFPNIVIKRISFVYDVDNVTTLMLSLWTSIEAKNFCQNYERHYGDRCEVRPYCLGSFRGVFGCCYCYPKVDGFLFYTKEKKELEKMIDEELNNTTRNPQRMAFVVFEDKSMAKEVYDHYKRNQCQCYSISTLLKRIFGHQSDEFDSWQWQISFAPFPDDINWSDIAVSGTRAVSLNLSMNLIIFIIFLFLSTPTSALNIVHYFIGNQKSGEVSSQMNSDPLILIFWSYIPTLGYTIMTSLLPAIIKILTTQIPFRTKSGYNHAIMYKSYLFLILMVLILPSLQIITVSQLFENQIESQFNVNDTGQAKGLALSCLFPAENGAFFINYLLTSAFVGNITEVIRISELISYAIAFALFSRTAAEYLTARQKTQFQFYFGTYYPRILLLFTLIVTFSIASPLIAPIGLFYMIVKHLVDRYLIYHIYVPTKISQRIHSKAIVFVYISLLFLLVQVYTHLASMKFFIPSAIVGVALILHFLFTLYELLRDLIVFCD